MGPLQLEPAPWARAVLHIPRQSDSGKGNGALYAPSLPTEYGSQSHYKKLADCTQLRRAGIHTETEKCMSVWPNEQ